jgi:hypothetical protein
MREMFSVQIDAWNRQQRGEITAATIAASTDDAVARTETSVPGPAPPIMYSDPAVPQLTGRRSGRAWTAVAIGVLVGSLATWIGSRHSPEPRVTPAAAPSPAPVVAAPPPARAVAAPARAVELPVPVPPASLPMKPVVAAPAPVADKPIAKRAATPPRRAIKKPPPKKPPPGWDPESILPP